jgi:hypothetical protein
VATPATIPAGAVSVQCAVTLAADPQLTNHTVWLATGYPGMQQIKLFLANRSNVQLDVFPPPQVSAGSPVTLDVSSPGVEAGAEYGPPLDLSARTFTVSAVDFDNPAVSIPVVLNDTAAGAIPYSQRRLTVTFPPENRRVKLVVITDDGITGFAAPVQISTDADGDGISDMVETALQRTPDQTAPPLILERDATGIRAVLGNRPLDLRGWTVVIETSADLQTWTSAAAASTTVTPNPDGRTERVSVLLNGGPKKQFARLTVTKP